MRKRFLSVKMVVTTVGVAAALALTPLAAASAAYTHSTEDFDFETDPGDLCTFSVHLTVHNEIESTELFPVGNGDSIAVLHVVETDTIAANGVTVDGLPYHYTLHVERNSDGKFVRIIATGEQWKFALPGGGIWTVSGVSNLQTDEHFGSWKTHDLGPVCDALAG